MKRRLIKQSNINYNSFLKLLLLDNVYSQDGIEKIIQNNPDCIYGGTAFRVFFFNTESVKEAKENYLKSVNKENDNQIDIFELLWGVLDNLIDINLEYQSFSKSEQGVKNANEHLRDGQEFGIIIKIEANSALDIEKLFNKYNDILDDETKDAFRYFKNQEEILAKLENDDYYYIGGIDFNRLRYL